MGIFSYLSKNPSSAQTTKQHYLFFLCATIYIYVWLPPLICLLPKTISYNTFSRSFQNFKPTKPTVKTFIRSLFFLSLWIKLCCFIFLFLFDATIILVPRTYVTVYLVFILAGLVWTFWVSSLVWSFNPFFLFVKNFFALMFFFFWVIGFEPRFLIFSKNKTKRFLIFCYFFFFFLPLILSIEKSLLFFF